MNKIKYSKAPVSEVILGVTLKEPFLIEKGYLFEIINDLKNEYPEITQLPPLVEQQLDGFKFRRIAEVKNSGPVLTRMRSSDLKWLIQLQFNKIYLNWIRKDGDDVGHYPGFTLIYEKFKKILEDKLKEDFYIKNYELTYQDRIFWQDKIDNLCQIEDLINIRIPSIEFDSYKYSPNNIFSEYTIPLEKIGGFALISVNTSTLKENNQIMSFQCCMQGYLDGISKDEWFSLARKIQFDLFHSSFNKELLESWK